MESLSFTPTGMDTVVTMDAAWPHPSFTGRYLPVEHHIDEGRFQATWKISAFSSSIQQAVDKLEQGSGHGLADNTFGVALINPVDIYQQSERSVKYGILFIGLHGPETVIVSRQGDLS